MSSLIHLESGSWTTDGKRALKQVNSALRSVANSHRIMDAAARSSAYQMLVHKNSTPMIALIQGLMGTSVHVKGLVDWVAENVGVSVAPIEKDKSKIKITYPEGYKLLTDEEAIEKINVIEAFWISNPPPAAFKGFSWADELNKLVKKAREMERASREGTIKVKGKITNLSDEEIAMIKLDGFDAAYGRLMGVQSPAVN